MSVALRESRPWLIVLVDPWWEKHRVQQVQSRLDYNAQTRSLKEERVKIGQIINSNPKQVKQGTVLRGPAGLAVFSCGIRLTPLEAVIDGCSLPKTQRNQVLVLSVISGPISKGTSFSRMLLLGPFRTTHSYFDNSVSICPTSVSHYKWTLSKHPSVHAKCKVTVFNCC